MTTKMNAVVQADEASSARNEEVVQEVTAGGKAWARGRVVQGVVPAEQVIEVAEAAVKVKDQGVAQGLAAQAEVLAVQVAEPAVPVPGVAAVVVEREENAWESAVVSADLNEGPATGIEMAASVITWLT